MANRLNKIMMAFALVLSVSAHGEAPTGLSAQDQQISHDLEELLTTKNQIVGEIQRDNLSLLQTALNYSKSEAFISFAVSSIISFYFVKDPIRYLTMYLVNFRTIVAAVRVQKALSEVQLVKIEELGVYSTLASMGISMTVPIIYMSSSLFQKGVCIFSCMDDVANRVTERQEAEFLRSPTFQQIEKEIGDVKAMRFFAYIKTIRKENYSNQDSLISLKRFVASIANQKVTSIDALEIPEAPTFLRVVKVLNSVYMMNDIVLGYLYSSGQST